mgnify:CR=1 FL=1
MFKKTKFALGMALGTLFGLAFAPKKGKELREEIIADVKKGGDSSKILKKTAKDIGADISTTAKEVYQDPSVQKQIKHGKKEAKKVFGDLRKKAELKAKELAKASKKKFNDTKSELEKDVKGAVSEMTDKKKAKK